MINPSLKECAQWFKKYTGLCYTGNSCRLYDRLTWFMCDKIRCKTFSDWAASCGGRTYNTSNEVLCETMRRRRLVCDVAGRIFVSERHPSQYTVSGHHRPASETSFQWRFAGGPLATHFKRFTGFSYRRISSLSFVSVSIMKWIFLYVLHHDIRLYV